MKKTTYYNQLIFLLLIFVCFSSLVFGQNTNDSLLTIDRIFNSEDFSAQSIGAVRWLKSGDAYTQIEPSTAVEGGRDLVSYDAASGARSILISADKLVPAGEKASLAIQNYEFSADNRKILVYTNSERVWRLNTRGDYWVLDLGNGKLKKLGGDAKVSTLMFAKFSSDGMRVGYVRENNLYVENLADGKITQLTVDGSPTLINGTSDWVNEEEFFLRDCWRWSPDGKWIAFWQFDASGVENYTLANDTDALYPKLTVIPYPKTGTTNAAVRIGIVAAASGGQIKWMNTPGDLRQNYLVSMDWAANSDELVIQHLNRLQNDYKLLLANAKTGTVKTVLSEKDDAWVDVRANKFLWTNGGKRFLWMSEKDGWQHLYTASRDGSDLKLITPGNYDVVSLQTVDEANNWVYFIASPDNAAQRYLYRIRLDGSSAAAEKVTPAEQTGTNSYSVSPNGKWAFHTRSAFRTVPSTELVNLQSKTSVRMMVDNHELQTKINNLKTGANEFFRIDAGGGLELDGWMMKPPDFDPNKKYPILFYVYGEPASQTVTDDWKSSTYLWHLMLTQQGYLVASVENRGTPAPKGHAWRKSVYRKIGAVVSEDQAKATTAMIAKMPFIDASRVGIWGWSGGGSSTLNAMFRYPDVYKTGMAVAPVPDLRLYDTIYEERYMGLPQEKSGEADYEQASAITFANNLKGNLLIVHGTGDDNVHYQGTERLINALVAANKTFAMMAYPNRTHGIFEGENTTRHLYTLLTKYLNEHLPIETAK